MSIPHEHRRSALVVHTLAPSDRTAVLAALSEEQRSMLLPLLEELADIGIPQDPQLLALSLERDAGEEARKEEDMEHALNALDKEDILLLLHHQPVELVVRILRCASWTWATEVIQRQEPLRRRQIETMLSGEVVLAPALSNALMLRAASCLRQERGRRESHHSARADSAASSRIGKALAFLGLKKGA